MMVTLTSVRGAPGVSTWAMLLAAAWPVDQERVVLEADLDGGVAGARYGVGVEPGVDELVARLRHGGDVPDALQLAGRRIDERGWLVPGPESPVVARRIWGAAGVVDGVAAVAQSDPRLWVVDAGRLRPGSAVARFATTSAATIVVTGDAPADLVQVPERVGDFQHNGHRVAVLVTGSPDYPVGELASFFGTQRVLVVPRIDLAAIKLVADGWASRRLRRSGLWRAALNVAQTIHEIATVGGAFAAPVWDHEFGFPSPPTDGVW